MKKFSVLALLVSVIFTSCYKSNLTELKPLNDPITKGVSTTSQLYPVTYLDFSDPTYNGWSVTNVQKRNPYIYYSPEDVAFMSTFGNSGFTFDFSVDNKVSLVSPMFGLEGNITVSIMYQARFLSLPQDFQCKTFLIGNTGDTVLLGNDNWTTYIPDVNGVTLQTFVQKRIFGRYKIGIQLCTANTGSWSNAVVMGNCNVFTDVPPAPTPTALSMRIRTIPPVLKASKPLAIKL
jgi:hypothetical protein